MKRLFLLVFLLLVAFGCQTKAEIVDNGNPGTIKIITYLDANTNKSLDPGEQMISDHVGISQDTSCPAGSLDAYISIDYTNPGGEIIYDDLKAGTYCVAYLGDKSTTTKLTYEIPLNSDQEIIIYYGILE